MPGSLRVAVRSLRKTPSFTLAALATLAVGIGATVAMLGSGAEREITRGWRNERAEAFTPGGKELVYSNR